MFVSFFPSNNLDKSPLHAASQYHQYSKQHQTTHTPNANPNHHTVLVQQQQQQQQQSSANLITTHRHPHNNNITTTTLTSSSSTNGQLINTTTTTTSMAATASQDKVLSVSGKKKCSHCGDELGNYCIYVGCEC